MERDEFLKSFGLGLALVCTGACFQSCGGGGSDDDEPEPGGNGNTVNVNLTERLLTVGSQYVTANVLFIRLAAGNSPASFVATQARCPHQGGSLNWRAADNRIQCETHASQYKTDGAVLQQPVGGGTTGPLKVYAVTISGNTLSATVA